jgi:hypothetical protein
LNRNANVGKAFSIAAMSAAELPRVSAGNASSSASCAHTGRRSNAAAIASAAAFGTPSASRVSAASASASAGGTAATANGTGSAAPPVRSPGPRAAVSRARFQRAAR